MNNFWRACLACFEKELPPQQYKTWIKPLQFHADGDRLLLVAPNRFVLQWIRDRFLGRIEQLATPVPGTYGSIIETMRHTVDSDWDYLLSLGLELDHPDWDTADLATLRSAMEAQGVAWLRLLTDDTDADRVVVRRHADGWVTHATVGIRFAQAIHHGTDHRSQICTALTSLGERPE